MHSSEIDTLQMCYEETVPYNWTPSVFCAVVYHANTAWRKKCICIFSVIGMRMFLLGRKYMCFCCCSIFAHSFNRFRYEQSNIVVVEKWSANSENWAHSHIIPTNNQRHCHNMLFCILTNTNILVYITAQPSGHRSAIIAYQQLDWLFVCDNSVFLSVDSRVNWMCHVPCVRQKPFAWTWTASIESEYG